MEVLKYNISPVQLRAIQSLFKKNINNQINEVLFGGAKNGGKSFLGSIALNMLACDDRFSDLSFFIARHTRKDLIDYTIPTINKFFKENNYDINKFCKYNGQTNTFHFRNRSRIHLIDTAFQPSDPMYERFGSMEMTGGWIEEGGEHHELAYENLKLSIGRQNNDKYNIPKFLLITCNPKKGWMKREFYDKDKSGNIEPNKTFIKSLVTDNTFRAAGSEDILNNINNKRDLLRLRFGEWEYDDDDYALMRFEKINDIFTNNFVKKTGKRFITCDIALSNDSFVLIVWDSLVIIDVVVINKIGAKTLCDTILDSAKKHSVPQSQILYDADGIGAYLREFIPSAIGINNGVKPTTPEFYNLKSQLYYMLADFINENKIYIDAPVSFEIKSRIIAELQVVKMNPDIVEKLAILPKPKIKAMIGHSPDISDAIAYRMLAFHMFNY
jgi:hypothetical protein